MVHQRPVLCSFESRRSEEMRSLIERFGGTPFSAPSMQELPAHSNAQAIDAIRQIVAGSVSHVIFLTGVGTEAMMNVAKSCHLADQLQRALADIPLLARGPKPATALKKYGLTHAVKAAEPNTFRELLEAIDAAKIDLDGASVAIQEYGLPSQELTGELNRRGACVLSIPVYRWALPDDITPLRQAVTKTIAGKFDALLFTSAQQLQHVLLVTNMMDARSDWLAAANRMVIGSIGPTCTRAIRSEGLSVTVEATPPKMGPLVRSIMQHQF